MNDVTGDFPELSARTGYGVNPIERLSERREDAAFVETCAADPSAVTILISGDLPILAGEREGMTALHGLLANSSVAFFGKI